MIRNNWYWVLKNLKNQKFRSGPNQLLNFFRQRVFFYIRTGPIFHFWSGPVRIFIGDFSFLWILESTLYFFQFSKFCSGPRTGPKKISAPVRIFRTKIRTTYRTEFEFGPNSGPRTGPEKIRTENPDHGPDQQISDQKSGPRTKIRTGPDFRYGPVVHECCHQFLLWR